MRDTYVLYIFAMINKIFFLSDLHNVVSVQVAQCNRLHLTILYPMHLKYKTLYIEIDQISEFHDHSHCTMYKKWQ